MSIKKTKGTFLRALFKSSKQPLKSDPNFPETNAFNRLQQSRFPNLVRYLQGTRNYYMLSRQRPATYNHYNRYLAFISAYIAARCLHHYCFLTEYDARKKTPNPFVPRYVY